jgi:hypothetical protein
MRDEGDTRADDPQILEVIARAFDILAR